MINKRYLILLPILALPDPSQPTHLRMGGVRCWGGCVLQIVQDMELVVNCVPDPVPLVRGTDPRIRIRIRTKMSRIQNSVVNIASKLGSEMETIHP